MTKRTVNKDIYENYIDATVALFMEYYSAVSFSQNVQAELDAANCDEIQFPEQLDDRCRQLIKKQTARSHRKRYLKNCVRGIKYAAACIMVVLSLVSVLFMTVEAVRVPIINYYIEQRDGHWEIDGGVKNESTKALEEIDLVTLLSDVMPGGYKLAQEEKNSLNETTIIYKDSNGKRFFCKVAPGNSWTAIDAENAQTSRQHKICGYDAITVMKDGRASLSWVHSDLGIVFSLIADDMSENELIGIGEQLIELINK